MLQELGATLRSAGVFHDFLERLKPRIQRVIRVQFAQQPAHGDPDALGEYLTQLYSYLMAEVSALLGSHYAPDAAQEALDLLAPPPQLPAGSSPVARLNSSSFDAIAKRAATAVDLDADAAEVSAAERTTDAGKAGVDA